MPICRPISRTVTSVKFTINRYVDDYNHLCTSQNVGHCLSPFSFNFFLYDTEAVLESGGFKGVSMSDITTRTLLFADALLLIQRRTSSSALISV